MNQEIPKSIYREGSSIQILWADGHKSVLEIGYLRRKCPCVMCKNTKERTMDGGIDLPSFSSKPIDITKTETIGRYAIHFLFNDGHSTGIYSYDHLRKICPCPDCVPKV